VADGASEWGSFASASATALAAGGLDGSDNDSSDSSCSDSGGSDGVSSSGNDGGGSSGDGLSVQHGFALVLATQAMWFLVSSGLPYAFDHLKTTLEARYKWARSPFEDDLVVLVLAPDLDAAERFACLADAAHAAAAAAAATAATTAAASTAATAAPAAASAASPPSFSPPPPAGALPLAPPPPPQTPPLARRTFGALSLSKVYAASPGAQLAIQDAADVDLELRGGAVLNFGAHNFKTLVPLANAVLEPFRCGALVADMGFATHSQNYLLSLVSFGTGGGGSSGGGGGGASRYGDKLRAFLVREDLLARAHALLVRSPALARVATAPRPSSPAVVPPSATPSSTPRSPVPPQSPQSPLSQSPWTSSSRAPSQQLAPPSSLPRTASVGRADRADMQPSFDDHLWHAFLQMALIYEPSHYQKQLFPIEVVVPLAWAQGSMS
jgi:hypothetical protein